MRTRTTNMALASIFAALTAIGAFIRIPFPYVPFTLQLFFCSMSGALLGARWGALSQIVYVAVGLVGVPVFTGGGGPSYIASPTFGYLLGFIATSWVVGKSVEFMDRISFVRLYGAALAGVVTVYAFGVPWLYMAHNLWMSDPQGLKWVLWYGFITGVGGDMVLALLVAFACLKILPLTRGKML